MKLKYLLLVLGAATSLAVGASDAPSPPGNVGQLSFRGEIYNAACDTSTPPNMQGGAGQCVTAGGVMLAAYRETEQPASGQSGIAMLDYFAQRPDGGSKRVLTRQYF